MWNAFTALKKRLPRPQNARNRARDPVPPPNSSTTIASPSLPSHPVTSIAIEHRSEGVQMAKNHRQAEEKRTRGSRSMSFNMQHPAITAYGLWCDVGHVGRIDVLPDDVLLEIFDFYMEKRLPSVTKTEVDAWHSLVHVCRRWRCLVFGSRHRLNLQLVCTPKTPSRDTLDVWPTLPLLIRGYMKLSPDADDIIVVLGHGSRVCEVDLDFWGTDRGQLEKVLAAMQVPFPELTELRLKSYDKTPPAIPDSFLGGSASPLRVFELYAIPFPGLPK